MTVPTEVSDEKILALLDQMKADTGQVPGRNDVMRVGGCGAPRATRLRKQWCDTNGVTLPGSTSQRPSPPAQTTNGHGAGPGQVDQTVPFARIMPDQGEPGPVQVEQRAGEQRTQTTNGNGHHAYHDGVDRSGPLVVDQTGPDQVDRTESEPGPDEVESGDDDGQAAVKKLAVKPSTWIYLVGAVIGLGVSINTSWRYFELKMGIDNVVERIAMFAGMEVVLVACGWAMFEAVRDPKANKIGPARLLGWALCGVSAWTALQLSGGGVGLARVALGPVLALVALHRALGIEKHASSNQRTSAWAKVGREWRERVLSRLGLADDDRTAVERTRLRAARRAARLARSSDRTTPFRKARLRRALRLADVAHQARMQDVMLAELRMLEHADALAGLEQPSPWERS